MIKLLVGHKGTGKTKMMVEMANRDIAEKDGSVVFIIKDDRLKHDLDINIRMIVMDDYEYVNNIDEYIGFIYGIMSSNHDIAVRDLPEFLRRLQVISDKSGIEFVVSLSADLEELDASVRQYEILNR